MVPASAERGFAVFALLVYLGPIYYLERSFPLIDGETVARVATHAVGAANLFLLFLWRQQVVRTIRQEKLLWVLMALALVSICWSHAPTLFSALRAEWHLVRLTLLGIYLAARFRPREQVSLLAWTFGIVALLSLVFVLAVPSHGIMGMQVDGLTAEHIKHAGAWQGVYFHKNSLGASSVLSGLVFFVFVKTTPRYRWLGWTGLLLSACLVVGSTSRTALATALILVIALACYEALRWRCQLALGFFVGALLLAGGAIALCIVKAEVILSAIGRDLTLSGRTKLWEGARYLLEKQPWLGYGYGGFWHEASKADPTVHQTIFMPQIHNGFLELGLDLGLAGLLIFVVGCLLICYRATSLVRQAKIASGFWPLAYLTCLMLTNLAESRLLGVGIYWILYVTVVLSIQKRRLR